MSFDALAPHYRWMEWVLAGEKLQRCRTTFLNRVQGARNILIAGEGNGRFLTALSSVIKEANITCVDASERMLSQTRARLERVGLPRQGIDFVHADILDWEAPRSTFNLIVTHFFLDCFRADQLKAIIEKLSRAAVGDAVWLLADFQVPAQGWRRRRAKAIHQMMYQFFRVATGMPARSLTPPDSFLEAQGFALVARKTSELDLLRSDMWVRGKGALRRDELRESENGLMIK